jgi:hypothetical protein
MVGTAELTQPPENVRRETPWGKRKKERKKIVKTTKLDCASRRRRDKKS